MRISRRRFLAVCGSALAMQDTGLKLEKIKETGDSDNRVNVVFIGEGYSRASQDKFDRTVESLISRAWGDGVLKAYRPYFNFYLIRTIVARDWDGSAKGTAFGTEAGRADLVMRPDWNKVTALLPRPFPEKYVLCLIVHNSDGVRSHGGGSETQGQLATGSSVPIFLHEFGHALGLLADEYPDGKRVSEKYSINVSQDENAVPWDAALRKGAPGVGVYKVPGQQRTFIRGEEKCIMAQTDNVYGPICRWSLLMGIYRHVRLLDEFGTNDRPVYAAVVPEIKIKLMQSEFGAPSVKWGLRTVKAEDAGALMRSVKAKDYTWDTFNEQSGWPLVPDRVESFPVERLPKGVHVVTVFAQDRNPWIYADPWKVTVDARSWVVAV